MMKTLATQFRDNEDAVREIADAKKHVAQIEGSLGIVRCTPKGRRIVQSFCDDVLNDLRLRAHSGAAMPPSYPFPTRWLWRAFPTLNPFFYNGMKINNSYHPYSDVFLAFSKTLMSEGLIGYVGRQGKNLYVEKLEIYR